MKQLKVFSLAFLTLLTVGLISCNQGEPAANNNNNNNNTSEVTPPAVEAKKQITMVVSHQVKDYATWRPFFDRNEADRNAAKMKLLGVYQDQADPTHVSVSVIVEDTASANKFFKSAALRDTMAAAGVIDTPEVKYYALEMVNEAAATNDNHLFVVVNITDFNAFSKAFASHDSLRKANEITPVIVARNLDSPNEIAVALTAKDMATLKTHFDSPEVKTAMQEATVVGEPLVVQYATKGKEAKPAM